MSEAPSKQTIRESLLDQVGKWFDSATHEESNDHSLVIQRSKLMRDPNGKIVAASFIVQATINVGGFVSPLEESRIVAPH